MPFRTINVVTEKSELSTTAATTIPNKVLKETTMQTSVVSTETTAEISTNLPGISEATTKITSNLTASTVNIVIERSDISTAIPPLDTSVPITEAETLPITLFHKMAVPTSVISSETLIEVSTDNPIITVNVEKKQHELLLLLFLRQPEK